MMPYCHTVSHTAVSHIRRCHLHKKCTFDPLSKILQTNNHLNVRCLTLGLELENSDVKLWLVISRWSHQCSKANRINKQIVGELFVSNAPVYASTGRALSNDQFSMNFFHSGSISIKRHACGQWSLAIYPKTENICRVFFTL